MQIENRACNSLLQSLYRLITKPKALVTISSTPYLLSALKRVSTCPQAQAQVAFVKGVRTGRGALLLAVFRGKVWR